MCNIYIIANTQKRGKAWAKARGYKRAKVWSTTDQPRGARVDQHDYVVIVDENVEVWKVALPAMMGCRVLNQVGVKY